MFAYTGLDEQQVGRAERRWGVYMVGRGRMCVSGLSGENVESVARGINDVDAES